MYSMSETNGGRVHSYESVNVRQVGYIRNTLCKFVATCEPNGSYITKYAIVTSEIGFESGGIVRHGLPENKGNESEGRVFKPFLPSCSYSWK